MGMILYQDPEPYISNSYNHIDYEKTQLKYNNQKHIILLLKLFHMNVFIDNFDCV